MRALAGVVAAGLLVWSANLASADVLNMGGTRDPATGQWTGQASLEFVTVGYPGNPGNGVLMNDGTYGYGAVSYAYQIGKYEVTASQYCHFLNSVASQSDPYGLYSPNMANPASLGSNYVGCGIAQTGSPGNYAYSVTKDPNFPVNFVCWADAARFCNWLSHGQPVSSEGPGTTETGSYTLTGTGQFYNPDGSVSSSNSSALTAALLAVGRNPGATYVIPTENEWYKAAYYAGTWYWQFPTRNPPYNAYGGAQYPSYANYWENYYYTDPTNYLTPVGHFAATPGYYGTFDMAGNVREWNEAIIGTKRGMLGGGFSTSNWVYFQDNYRASAPVLGEGPDTGFRIALVPEPATLSLLALGGLLIGRRRRA